MSAAGVDRVEVGVVGGTDGDLSPSRVRGNQ